MMGYETRDRRAYNGRGRGRERDVWKTAFKQGLEHEFGALEDAVRLGNCRAHPSDASRSAKLVRNLSVNNMEVRSRLAYSVALPAHLFPQLLAPSNSSTAAAVTFITFVQDLKRKTKTWGPMIELCASGEKTLERFRYQFPDDWLYSDQLRGEWSAFNEILKRKNDSIQEQLGEYS